MTILNLCLPPIPLDSFGDLWQGLKILLDQSNLSSAEKLGVLLVIQAEMTTNINQTIEAARTSETP